MQAQTLYDLPTIYDRVVPPGPCESFYRSLAAERGGRVLELGCGTGRLPLPLARDGHEVTGVDLSGSMLATARAKADAAGLPITWLRDDMAQLDLGRRFDLVIVSCNSLAHLLTADALVGCLRTIRRHMEPWGAFAFDVVNPNLKRLSRPPAERLRRAHSVGSGVRVHERAFYDPDRQILEARWRIHSSDGEVLLEPLRLRQIFPSELPEALAGAGLRLSHRFGDFEGGRFGSASRNQVCIAQTSDFQFKSRVQ